jgi:hypothetical protein
LVWLAGWLVGWLAGWLVGWLAGWLVGCWLQPKSLASHMFVNQLSLAPWLAQLYKLIRLELVPLLDGQLAEHLVQLLFLLVLCFNQLE